MFTVWLMAVLCILSSSLLPANFRSVSYLAVTSRIFTVQCVKNQYNRKNSWSNSREIRIADKVWIFNSDSDWLFFSPFKACFFSLEKTLQSNKLVG